MMDSVTLNYGEGTVELPIKGAASLRFLEESPTPSITDLPGAFERAVTEECIGTPPLKQLISPGEKVTVVISDITRHWMRQDKVCELLVKYLNETMGVPFADITVLVALGTHRPMTAQELETIASKYVCENVKVRNHDCDGPCVELGVTSRGTAVQVNALAAQSKVILIGGTAHHLMAGFGGGRKSVVPGIASRDTILQNHIHSLSPTQPRSNPLIGMGLLAENPVNEDMDEAAALLAPVFSINIVSDSHARHCRLFCGHWHEAWLESCRFVRAMSGVPIDRKADVVIVSCGGYPKDINLYQAVKSLLNAAEAIKDGGTMLFLAQCREGGGAPAFFDWIKPLRAGRLDEALRAGFTIAGYIFYACCEALRRFRVVMLTEIEPEILAPMNIFAFQSSEQIMENVDLNGRDVYIMPFGGSIVPYLQDA